MSQDVERLGNAAPSRRRMTARAALAASALLLTGSLIGWGAATDGFTPAATPLAASPVTAAPDAAPRPEGGVESYAPVVDRITPAVVTIRSERRATRVTSPFGGNPLLREFFGDQFQRPEPPRREGGLGSGVIVRPDGYVLTNHHVVDAAEKVRVELTDGRTFDAKVVGSDAPSDLAVLKIEGSNLQTVPLGDSDAVRVGDVALAIGNPLGVGQTVTMGIISAKGRATGLGDGSFEDFIQTDAPINRGNSGGALVNTRGELIGINSQILSPSGGSIGIGFAIPANMARSVMTQLIDHGEVRRGLLGVTVQPVTSDIARSLGLTKVQGALVNSVQAGGAADKAGLRRGDVIVAVNGTPVKDGNNLRNEIAGMLPGASAKLGIVRDAKEQSVDVRLGELRVDRSATEDSTEAIDTAGVGLVVEPLTRESARRLGVKATSGLVVVDVRSSSRAADAGIRPGDVIEEIDRRKVDSGEALREALAEGEGPALVLVHRGEASLYLTLERHTS